MPSAQRRGSLSADVADTSALPDRTALYAALRKAHRVGRNGSVREIDFEQPEVLHLSKLPCWAHLDDHAYRKAVAELVADILLEHRERAATVDPAAIARIRRQDPEHRRRLHQAVAGGEEVSAKR